MKMEALQGNLNDIRERLTSKIGGDNYSCPHKFRYPYETAIWTIANICPSDDGLAQLCVAAKCRCYVVLRSLAGLTRQTDRIPLLFQCIFSLKTIRPRRTWKSPQLDWLSLNFFPSTFQIPADKKKKEGTILHSNRWFQLTAMEPK